MYTVIIKHEREETRLTSREWYNTGEKDDEGNNKWDYSPQVEEKKIVTSTLLEQSVEDLDMVSVIKAINGIA